MATHANAHDALPPIARPFLARRWKVMVALAILLLAVLVFALQSAQSDRAAVMRMSPEARQELYVRTLRSTESLCTQAAKDESMRGRCVDSSRFLLSFPECDEACRALAQPHFGGATR